MNVYAMGMLLRKMWDFEGVWVLQEVRIGLNSGLLDVRKKLNQCRQTCWHIFSQDFVNIFLISNCLIL